MNIEEALKKLNALHQIEAVAPGWEASQRALPEGGPAFLQPEQIIANRAWCDFGTEVDAALLHTAERIRTDETLRRFAWHCAWRLYDAPEASWFADWPTLESVLGEDAGIFYLLVGISFALQVRAFHQAMHIPEAITQATLQQPRCFADNYAKMHSGKLGIPRSQLGWLRHYTREKYFRLGRFEYWLKPHYEHGVHVYRHTTNGRVLAFAPSGARLDDDGYALDPENTAGWQTTLAITPDTITGYPISPRGYVLPDPVSIPRPEWQSALQPGDYVLDMHIPAGGGLSFETWSASMRQAAAFFPAHFPDMLPKAFVCLSWMYSPDLEKLLPPESNLVRHLSEMYLFPVPGAYLWFIFMQDEFDPATAPRDTSLQRAVLAYLEQGHAWHDGGMFLLMEDLDKLGTGYYRTTAE
ncbi:MAG: DUF5596 domain-containing protein [Anaerolineales bacterium]|nr:DUF5596 domain-containing protein [Anaerolineales bacterium]